jgi:O-antigen ligase
MVGGSRGQDSIPSQRIASRRGTARSRAAIKPRIPWLVALFFISMLAPPQAQFRIDTINLSVQRVLLLLSILPCAFMLVAGRAGRLRLVDGLIVLHSLWAVLTLAVNDGLSVAVKSGGIYVVETVGPYLIARVYLRRESDFIGWVRFYTLMVVGLSVLTIPEAVTGVHYFANLFGKWTDEEIYMSKEVRLGLTRAYGPFRHPILYGIFCATSLGLAWYTLNRGTSNLRKIVVSLFIVISTVMSMSTVAFLSIGVQGILIIWDAVLAKWKGRWKAFVLFLIIMFSVAAIFSNRGPVMAIVGRISLDPQTAYMRQAIWDAGTSNVRAHPVFGIGYGDWARPNWIPASVDNFWLLTAMRHGVPGLGFLAAAFILVLFSIQKKRNLPRTVSQLRQGWIVSMLSLALAAATVHFWVTSLTYFFFMIGSATWILEAPIRKNHSGIAMNPHRN